MKGQYTHYLKIPNTSQGLGLRITDRYDWQTFTYKEVEKSGTRDVMVEIPTEPVETITIGTSVYNKAEFEEAVNGLKTIS